MAEGVNERLEALLPDLLDMERKDIFTRGEIRKIVEKRRAFEYRLLSNAKHDFLQYIEYELALEELRKKRSRQRGWHKKRTLSDSSGIRHIASIFERSLTRKYKNDVALWFQYIDFCLQAGSVKMVQRVIRNALRIHPAEERLWLLAADRELRMGHLEATRKLLLRGIRINPRPRRLWQQYLKLEMLAVAHLQQRQGAQSLLEGAAEGAETPQQSAAEAGAVFAVVRVALRRALTKVEAEGRAAVLEYAFTLAVDHRCAAEGAAQRAWAAFAEETAALVDSHLESQDPQMWAFWWAKTGPRDADAQARVVLARAAPAVVAAWLGARPCGALPDAVVDAVAAHEKATQSAEVLAALPTTTEGARAAIRAGVARFLDLRLAAREWGLREEAPTAPQILGSVQKSSVDAASAASVIRVLPLESQAEGLRCLLGKGLPRGTMEALARQLLAFQLSAGDESYRRCVQRLTSWTSDLRVLRAKDSLLAVIDAVLDVEATLSAAEGAAALGRKELGALFDFACSSEADEERAVGLWVRYEEFVERTGGDAAAIRRRASRSVSEQALIECRQAVP